MWVPGYTRVSVMKMSNAVVSSELVEALYSLDDCS